MELAKNAQKPRAIEKKHLDKTGNQAYTASRCEGRIGEESSSMARNHTKKHAAPVADGTGPTRVNKISGNDGEPVAKRSYAEITEVNSPRRSDGDSEYRAVQSRRQKRLG